MNGTYLARQGTRTNELGTNDNYANTLLLYFSSVGDVGCVEIFWLLVLGCLVEERLVLGSEGGRVLVVYLVFFFLTNNLTF